MSKAVDTVMQEFEQQLVLRRAREAEGSGEFSVYTFIGDWQQPVGIRLDAESAVVMSRTLVDTQGCKTGLIRRVIITDAEDYTCFDWRFGEGVVFSTKDTPTMEIFDEASRPRGAKYGE